MVCVMSAALCLIGAAWFMSRNKGTDEKKPRERGFCDAGLVYTQPVGFGVPA